MFEEFQQTAKTIFENAQRRGALIRNPDTARLKALALEEPEVRQTKYGSILADSEPMSRAAKFTRNNVDTRFGQAEYELLENAKRGLAEEELVSIDVQVGDGTEGITARLIVPRRAAHVAYGGLRLFKPAMTDSPTYQVIMFFDEEHEKNRSKPLPQKQIAIRLAHARDGRFRGFEAGGLFVKTDCLNPGDQIEAYYACLRPHTFLENVSVTDDGSIDFYDLSRTSNGRAVIERRDFMHAANDINARRIDNLFLITRGNIIPAVAKLTHEQATAFMVLGQSMESSAGDPTQAGQIKNEFFYDPFVAGDRCDHANLFYDILKSNARINCYLLNTGFVGEGHSYKDITLADTMGILDSLFRGGAEDWHLSHKTGLVIPRSIRAVDSILMRPEKLFTAAEFEARQRALNRQRAEYMDNFPGIEPAVKAVFQTRAVAVGQVG